MSDQIIEPGIADPSDELITAYWLLFCSRPRNPEPDETGAYFIGDVGEARLQDQRLNRETPYSICKGIRP